VAGRAVSMRVGGMDLLVETMPVAGTEQTSGKLDQRGRRERRLNDRANTVVTQVHAIQQCSLFPSSLGSGPMPGGTVAGPAGCCGSGGWIQGDGVAEGFECCDQAAGEVVGAELVVGFAYGQDVPWVTPIKSSRSCRGARQSFTGHQIRAHARDAYGLGCPVRNDSIRAVKGVPSWNRNACPASG